MRSDHDATSEESWFGRSQFESEDLWLAEARRPSRLRRPPTRPFRPIRPIRPPFIVPVGPRPVPPSTPERPLPSTPPEGGAGTPSSSPTPLPAATDFFKDSPKLQSAQLAPDSPVAIEASWPAVRKLIAETFNRLGGLMRAVAAEVGIEVPSALAVWYVESGGRKHTKDRAIIRFENHLLFRSWGQTNLETYNRHFRHGGHNGEPGKAWENHKFHENAEPPFRAFHGDQALEYRVLSLASRLAGRATALRCISIGGPQILISNHRLLGYDSPQAMFDAFQASERWHVLGFFDFCRHTKAPRRGDLFLYLRDHDWKKFARYYNGAGQVELYGGRIGNAHDHARALGV